MLSMLVYYPGVWFQWPEYLQRILIADYFETIRQGICNNYSNNYHIIMVMIYNQNILLIYTIIP